MENVSNEHVLSHPGGVIEFGTEYVDKSTLQYDLGLHCESIGRSVRYPKSDVRWLLAKCPNKDCSFELHARYQTKQGIWKVTKVVPHSLEDGCHTPEKKQRVRSSALLKKHNPLAKRIRRSEGDTDGLGKVWDVVGGDAPLGAWKGWDVSVVSLLEHCNLCYLATTSDGKPELSMMFFIWDPNTLTLQFTTPKDRKYENMMRNGNVAVLLHNYEGSAATNSLLAGLRPLAITMYGDVAHIGENPSDLIDVNDAETGSGGFRYAGAFSGSGKVTCRIRIRELLLVNVKGSSLRLRMRE